MRRIDEVDPRANQTAPARTKISAAHIHAERDYEISPAVESGIALNSANKIVPQKNHCVILRERFGLSSQMTVRCIDEVCSRVNRDKTIRPRLRSLVAVPYDRRIGSFKSLDRIALLTLEGRIVMP